MSFKDIALPYAHMGFRVIPIPPKEKGCKLPNWTELASNDPEQIDKWNTQEPDGNFGLVANENLCFLEFDIPGGMKAAAKEMGQPIPQTRVHVSGRGYAHYLFVPTERSRMIGNRSVNLPDGSGEWFSFRSDRKYVVGPGSVHPNGISYKVGRDVPPLTIPDWVCDFIEKHSAPKQRRNKEGVPVADDFDFGDFLDWYDINVITVENDWHITDVCPVAGYRHEHSKATGFYFDGAFLGWHCFAQGCAGADMTVGQVIRHLNEHHAPYPKAIWPDREIDFGSMNVEILEAGVEEADAISGPEPETIISAADLLVSLESAANKLMLDKPVEVVVSKKGRSKRLEPMPESCMYGWLGNKARGLEMPLGYAYPAIMTAFAGQNITMISDMVRPTLYTCLIGPIHSGKSVAIERACRSLIYSNQDGIITDTPGSDRGLYNLFAAPKCKPGEEPVKILKTHLLAQDELRDTFGKISVQGSSLAPTLCKLWSQDEAGSADKTGCHHVSVRLSILGALKAKDTEDFADVFGKGANDGLYDRFVFGVIPKGWKWEPWAPNPERRFPKGTSIPLDIFNMLREWRNANAEQDADRYRLGEIALRVALITASANHDAEVTFECMRAALEFCEWQEQIRNTYKAGESETLDAKCMAAVMDTFERLHGKSLKWSDVAKRKHWYKKYGTILSRVKESLVRDGVLVEESIAEEDETGRLSGKRKKTGRIFMPLEVAAEQALEKQRMGKEEPSPVSA